MRTFLITSPRIKRKISCKGGISLYKRLAITTVLLCFVLLFSPSLQGENVCWEEVVKENYSLLEEDPEDIFLNFQLGVSYAKTGRVEPAFEKLNTLKDLGGEKIKSQVPEYYQNKLGENNTKDYIKNLSYLSFAYYANNENHRAKESFKELISVEPDNIWNYNYLALVHRELEEYQEAQNLLQQSLDIENNNYTRFLLGVAYYDQGKVFRALVQVGRAGSVAVKILNYSNSEVEINNDL